MVGHGRQSGRGSRASLGFTIAESLAAVAIVGVLIGLLLPALGGAQHAARRAACASMQKQLALGLARYAAEQDEWIPGFNTSGYSLWPVASTPAALALSKHAHAPVQINDWMSPALAGSDLPASREDRFYTLLERHACPEMSLRSPVWIGGDAGSRAMADWMEQNDKPPAHGLSYLMPTNFQLYGGPRAPRDAYITQYSSNKFQQLARICTLRPDYQPRMDSLGSLSKKIALADGFRYIDARTIDFDASYSHVQWGSFTDRSACDVDSRSWGRRGGGGTAYNLPLVYRHSGRLLAAFWDGHVDQLDVKSSRNPVLWAPRGSKVQPAMAAEPDSLTFGYTPREPGRDVIE
jgi:prepilin-type processing-associated H-X9-DG protein